MEDVKSHFYRGLSLFGIDKLISECGSVIVAYSGGADSQLLLKFMKEYLDKSGVKLYAAHVNHMIRGEDADKDEEMCRIWAHEANVEIFVRRVDVPLIAKESGLGIEEAARRERYRFFDDLIKKTGGRTVVATAHNSDDNLETVIFNLMRGAGTTGMSGIPPIRDSKYVRPMLLCQGSEIRAYCNINKIPYVTDKTNFDTGYTRNYIRAEIVPKLCKLNSSPQSAVSRMSYLLRRDSEFIDFEAKKISQKAHDGTIDKSLVLNLHVAVLSRVLSDVYFSVAGENNLSYVHISDIIKLIQTSSKESELCLPGKIKVLIDREKIRFLKTDCLENGELHNKKSDSENFVIKPDGPFYSNENFIIKLLTDLCKTSSDIDENIYNLSIHKAINFDKIKGEFIIRRRKNGDKYRFGNMTRSLKKLFSDKKIPINIRDSLPVLCDDDGIIWVPGFPVRDGLEASENEKNIVHICCYERQHT